MKRKWWHPRLRKLIGETVKVLLPGERPWVEIIDAEDGRIKGRIKNKLYAEYSEHEKAQFMKREFGSVDELPILHQYHKNDEVWFEIGTGNRSGWWVPVESIANG